MGRNLPDDDGHTIYISGAVLEDKDEDQLGGLIHLAVMPCAMSISMKVRSGAKLPTVSLSLTPVSVNATTL